MAVEMHIEKLEQRHQELESQLSELQCQPSVSDSRLADLKRQKLQLKDRIQKLRDEHRLH